MTQEKIQSHTEQITIKEQEETDEQLDILLETDPIKKITETFVDVQTKFNCQQELPFIVGQDACKNTFVSQGFGDPTLWLQTLASTQNLYDIVDLANIQTVHDSDLGFTKPVQNIHDAVSFFVSFYQKAIKTTSLSPGDSLFSYYIVLYWQTGKSFSEKKIKRLYGRYLRKNKDILLPSYMQAYQKALDDIQGPYQERTKQMDIWKQKKQAYDLSFDAYVEAYANVLQLQQDTKLLGEEIIQLQNEIFALKEKKKQLENDIKNNVGDINKLQQDFFATEMALRNKQSALVDKLPKGGTNEVPYEVKISPAFLSEETEEKKQEDIRRNQINYFLHRYGQKEFDADTIFAATDSVLGQVLSGGELAHRYEHTDVIVDRRMLIDYALAIIYNDSHFGTGGLAKRTKNPGNVGNTDDGRIRTFATWQQGLEACLLNVYNRIYRYKVAFPGQEPTIQEIIENRERTTGRGFVRLLFHDVQKKEKQGLTGDALWYKIGNHTGENKYRTIVKENAKGEKVSITMNPEGAYMTTHPGGKSVDILYKKIQKTYELMSRLYEIKLFESQMDIDIAQNTQMESDETFLILQKRQIYKQLNELDIETENYLQSHAFLSDQERQNLALLDEKDGLFETLLLEQRNTMPLVQQKYHDFLQKKQELQEQEEKMIQLQTHLTYYFKNIQTLEEQMFTIDAHKTCKEQLIMLKDAILGKKSQLFTPYQQDFSFSPTIIDPYYVNSLKNIENNFLSLQSHQQQYRISGSEITVHGDNTRKIIGEFEEKNIDLMPLSSLAIGIGDSIGQMMRYRGNDTMYTGFRGMQGYPGATTSELVEKMQNFFLHEKNKNKSIIDKASYFVFEGGYNDRGTYKGKQITPQQTKENIKQAYRLVQQYNMYRKSKGLEPIKLVVCGMYTPLPRAGDFSAQQKAIYDGAKECGDDVLYIDVDAFVKQFNPKKFFRSGGLHPTERGAKQLNAYIQYCIMQDRIKQKR